MAEPTIFARASGGGRSAVALIRLSGAGSAEAVTALAGRLPAPRRASLVTLREPSSGEALDRALVLWFPGPQSFTGEDAAELHLHGGRAVVTAVLKALSTLSGLRPADPGEFTRRAFRNGKMDLTEVEGLADLIDAETDTQRRQALRQMDGALSLWASDLRKALIEAQALAEAMIDFADEDDLVADFNAELHQRVTLVRALIDRQLAMADRSEKLREGVVVTIAGAPNVGKSTLLNRLAGRDVAIVSAFAGTTRDVIEVDLDLAGYAVRIVDTAGLRPTIDPVEQEGIARARSKAAEADLVLWLDDGSPASGAMPFRAGNVWRVKTKQDCGGASPEHRFTLSAHTGSGIDALIDALTGFASHLFAGTETALVTRLRHRQALETALRHLDWICGDKGVSGTELTAETLRLAVLALAALTSTIDTEAVLGEIFARFCIGK